MKDVNFFPTLLLTVLITVVQLHLSRMTHTDISLCRYLFTLLMFHKVIESENISNWKGPIRITVLSVNLPIVRKEIQFEISQILCISDSVNVNLHQPSASKINVTLEAAHIPLNQALSFGQLNSSKAPLPILIKDFINLSTYMRIVTAETCTILSDEAQGSRKPVLSGKPDGVYMRDSVIKKMSLDTFV